MNTQGNNQSKTTTLDVRVVAVQVNDYLVSDRFPGVAYKVLSVTRHLTNDEIIVIATQEDGDEDIMFAQYNRDDIVTVERTTK